MAEALFCFEYLTSRRLPLHTVILITWTGLALCLPLSRVPGSSSKVPYGLTGLNKIICI